MSALRRIIETAFHEFHNAIELPCDDYAGLEAELVRYNDFTSRACYTWKKGRGLSRIDMAHMVLPNTGTLEQALAHIQRCNHFGIYLFEGVADEFKVVSTWPTLRKFVADRTINRKIMLFAGTNLRVPDHMSELFIKHEVTVAAKTNERPSLTSLLRFG